jgi:hypothetical protein
MQGNDGKFKLEHDENELRPSLRAQRSNPEMQRKAELLRRFAPRNDAAHQSYRLVSRQPAASASSVEQNQRVPLLICIWIFAYQRLVGL